MSNESQGRKLCENAEYGGLSKNADHRGRLTRKNFKITLSKTP